MTEKEKFEEAKRLYQTANADQRYVIETLFPELKESEDEKIRESLLEYLHTLPNHYSHNGVCAPEWIDWLEKQGEKNNNEDADILQRFSFYSYKDEPNVLYLSNVFVNKEYSNKGIGTKILKIADEVSTYLKCNSIRLKTKNGSNAESLYRKNGYKTLTEEGKHIWLEKQGEQESADKHEPKFKVGDWVVDKNGVIKQILSYKNGVYKHTNGYSSKIFEDDWRIWDITKDAKDGDVLSTPNYIYIFNSIDKETETVAFYCLINKSDERFSFGDYRIHDEILNSTPATKEQYDLLFSKMKEASYEWNAEKKELKKISQRMVSAEAKEALYDKPAWSKEDDDMITTIEGWLDTLCEYLNDSSSEYIPYIESCINWLESLRLQNMWKPSDDQIEALGVVTDICSIPEKQYDELNKLYHELKKLKGE